MHALDAGLIINALSGLFMVALGTFVLLVRSRRRVNLGFALFAIPFGWTWVLENVWGPSGDHRWPWVLTTIGGSLALASVGLILLAGAFHTARDPASRRHARLAIVIAIGVLLADIAFFLPTYEADLQAQVVSLVELLGMWSFQAAAWGLLAFLALRYRRALQDRPQEAAGIRLTSLALVLYPAFFAARETVVSLDVMGWPPGLVIAGVALVVAKTSGIAVLWLRNAAGSPHAALDRWLAWLAVTAALIGIPDAGFGNNHPGYGIARTLGVVILAYGILRHQLLGIDVKLRWTISRSTVAAAFIAVFFVASEGAQIVFGQRNEWVGLVAAGTLVFAIAPLQRAAERLAERAVPLGPLGGPGAVGHRPQVGEASFRKMARLAMRDGTLTREEEGHLHELARDLGLDGAQAHAIIAKVEREVSP